MKLTIITHVDHWPSKFIRLEVMPTVEWSVNGFQRKEVPLEANVLILSFSSVKLRGTFVQYVLMKALHFPLYDRSKTRG